MKKLIITSPDGTETIVDWVTEVKITLKISVLESLILERGKKLNIAGDTYQVIGDDGYDDDDDVPF